MGVYDFKSLFEHLGHEIEVVSYGDEDGVQNVSCECTTCNTVLIDYDVDEPKIEPKKETSFFIPVEKAGIQGRNGYTDLREIQVLPSSLGQVHILGISKKRGVCINGGFYDLTSEEMDNLAYTWLASRNREVCPSCGNDAHEELRFTGDREWTEDGLDGMIECLLCGDEFWVTCVAYDTIGGERGTDVGT